MNYESRADISSTPMSPYQIDQWQRKMKEPIPEEVIRTINRKLGETAVKGVATLICSDIMDGLKLEPSKQEHSVLKWSWLDVVSKYQLVDWDVTYCRPTNEENGVEQLKFKKRPPRTYMD